MRENDHEPLPSSFVGPRLPANYGVRLRRYEGEKILAKPLGPAPDYPPFTLPPLPGTVVERASAFLRFCWHSVQCSAMFALYIHALEHKWWALMPPQRCDREDVIANMTYEGLEGPTMHLKFAGFLRSSPVADPSELELLLPPNDGVFLFLNPLAGWTHLTCFLRLDGETTLRVLPHDIIDDQIEDYLYLGDRIWRTDPA